MKRHTFVSMVLLAGACAAFVPPAVAQHEHPAGDPGKLGNPDLLLDRSRLEPLSADEIRKLFND
ncbi:MAG: hypothetical protein ABSB66_16095 [Candidatus Acidiferrales bacterium]|jgi:hypothetical protein